MLFDTPDLYEHCNEKNRCQLYMYIINLRNTSFSRFVLVVFFCVRILFIAGCSIFARCSFSSINIIRCCACIQKVSFIFLDFFSPVAFFVPFNIHRFERCEHTNQQKSKNRRKKHAKVATKLRKAMMMTTTATSTTDRNDQPPNQNEALKMSDMHRQ